MYSCSQVDFV